MHYQSFLIYAGNKNQKRTNTKMMNLKNLQSLKKGSHIHLIGVAGTAMASLAGLLNKKGFKVTGSDLNPYPPMSLELEKLKIPVFKGYNAKNLKPPPDFVIVGNVAQKKFPEVKALLKSKIPYTSLPHALFDLILEHSKSIVISGTHGKTSITSLMAWIAQNCNINSGFLIGGFPKNLPHSFKLPSIKSLKSPKKQKSSDQPWFIIEGDEYDTAFFDKVPKFTYYNAKFLILSSLEFDHADIYKNLKQLKEVFISLVKSIPKDGIIIANKEDKNVMNILNHTPCKRIFTYGYTQGDYRIKNRSFLNHHKFTITRFGKEISDVKIKSYGLYNALNSLAAFALAYELGWEKRKILYSLSTFLGVENRQDIIIKEGDKKKEKIASTRNSKKSKGAQANRSNRTTQASKITIIKDFAHHPTSVRLTIEGLRERFPKKRMIVIFEPRSFSSRHKVFQNEYIKAFKASDIAIIASPYKSSQIKKEDRLSSKDLSENIRKTGVHSLSKRNTKDIIAYLKKEVQKGDIILILSNGPFDHIESQILRSLKSFKSLNKVI